MAIEDQDKTDPATEYKLSKAREQGKVARSQEVNFAVLLLGATCVLSAMGMDMSRDFVHLGQSIFLHLDVAQADPALLPGVIGQAVISASMILVKPIVLLTLLVIVAGLAQVGFVPSTDPLTPDFDKLNPASGVQRLFSMRSLFELGRSLLKISIIVAIMWLAGGSVLQESLTLIHRSAPALLDHLIRTTCWILALMTVVFGILAAMDLGYMRWDFLKNMRMSKKEVKDEHKQREGDPRVKSRLRELRAEWLKKSMAVQNVKQADVLITNPTHLAVAIVYKRESMAAPRILAKGSGSVAQRMKEIARHHGVMVVENRPLARALHREAAPHGDLPEQHYAEMARILAWVYAARRKSAAAAG